MQPLFAVLWICHVVSAQSIITLWQFGQGNLLSAQLTLPLTPLGTAADGLSTTYLYQALNNIVTDQTNDGVTQVVTLGSATPRTIVASASGWVENFASQSHMIACTLINSAEGNCIYVNFASSTTTSIGPTVAPFPEILTVATSIPLTTAPPPPSQTIASTAQVSSTAAPNTAQPEDSSKKSSSVGSIVGGVVGGLAGLSILLVLFLLWRRRRLQELKAAGTISAFNVGVSEFAEPNDVLRRPIFREFSDPRYEVEGESSDTIPNSDNNLLPAVEANSKAGRALRAENTNSSLTISTTQQATNSSEFGSDPQSLHITMAEIASRLRRLERDNSRMEPPPVYAENI
jgi:hypothetical protein